MNKWSTITTACTFSHCSFQFLKNINVLIIFYIFNIHVMECILTIDSLDAEKNNIIRRQQNMLALNRCLLGS